MSRIDEILELIDQELVSEIIDFPIDWILACNPIPEMEGISHVQFNGLLADVITLIYQDGLRNPVELSRETALCEGIWILENFYQGDDGSTQYDGAFYDANRDEVDGVKIVVDRLAGIIKINERKKYSDWVFSTKIDYLTWEEKKQIVQEILDRFGDMLHPGIRDKPVIQLVPHIENFLIEISTNQIHLLI